MQFKSFDWLNHHGMFDNYSPRRSEYYTLNVWSRGKQLVLFSLES